MREIAPGLYTFTGLPVGRVYMTRDADGLTLIDASVPPAAAAILKQIGAMGHRPEDVRRILITHAHPDHVGALPALKRATGARVYVSRLERPAAEGNIPIPGPPPEALGPIARRLKPPPTTLEGTPVDVELHEGDVIPEALGGLTALHTPGHAPGHTAFWQAERRILFCGDVIFRLGRLGLPFPFFTCDMAENIRSIGRLAALDPAIVCFGHGPPMTRDTAARIRAFAAKVGGRPT